MSKIQIQIYNTHCLVNAEKSEHNLLWRILSYEIKDSYFIKKRTGNFKWDGTASFYNRKTCQFLTGLLDTVIKNLKFNGVRYELYDCRKEPKILDHSEWKTFHGGLTLRDYQIEAVEAFLKHKRGIIKAGTGSGKTLTSISIFKKLGVPTIFLTHKLDLLYQSKERFESAIPEIAPVTGAISGYDFEPNFLTFATVQTLQNHYKENPKSDLLDKFQFMIIDEAHRTGAKSFYDTANKCKNAYYRLGLTATPFMKEDVKDNMNLKGVCGNIVYNITPSELIERSYIAKPYFKFFPINEPDMKKVNGWHTIYSKGIVENEYRNDLIVNRTLTLIDMGRKPLIIVLQKKHSDILEKKFKETGCKITSVSGSSDVFKRQKALKDLSNGKIHGIIATNIFDEGIDCADLDALVLAAGTKSAPAFFQRAGRTLRKPTEESYAIVIDFIDNQHKKLLEHSKKRYQFVKDEPNFVLLD